MKKENNFFIAQRGKFFNISVKSNMMIYLDVVALVVFFAMLLFTNTSYALNITKREIDDELFRAVEWRYGNDKIEGLLRKGADPDAESLRDMSTIEVGETVWVYVLQHSSPGIIALLRQYRKSGYPPSPKIQARAFGVAMSTTQANNPGYSQERIKLLIDNGLDVNAINLEDLTNKARSGSEGLSPLMIAVQKDREDFVKFLISKGANVNLQARMGETALFFSRSAAITRDLLEAGVDAGAVGQYGRTALHEAIFDGRAEVVSVLLDKGGDLKRQKADEALLLASRIMIQTTNQNAAQNSPKIIKMLLDHGVDPNLVIEKEGLKDTPLLEAVRANNTAGVKFLLGAGAYPVKVLNGKGTLLELAVQQDDPEITRLLLPKYLPLSDKDKESLLRVVLQYGKPKALAVLAENGIKVTEAKNDPMALTAVEAIVHAVEEDKVDKVEALLNQGININASGYNQTPLTAAVYSENKRMVEFFVDKGADVNQADKSGMTPLGTAISQGSLEIYEFLKLKKANLVSHDSAHLYLHLALDGLFHYKLIATRGNRGKNDVFDILLDLIKAGNPVDQVDTEGITPLWKLTTQLPGSSFVAGESQVVEIAKLFLQHGATVDKVPDQCKDFSAKTGVPTQISRSQAQDISVPAASDTNRAPAWVDPQARYNYLCRTPLSNAAAVGSKAVAMVLIEAGAKINWQSPVNGKTPLMLAALYGDPQLVTMLLDKGADPKLRDTQNKTAADIAREQGNTKALSILEKSGKEALK